MLMNVWYILSGIIGAILAIGGFICFLIGTLLFILGFPTTIKDKDYNDLPFLLSIICFCIIFSLSIFFMNIKIPQQQKLVSTEITNIKSYEGIANVKEGKYNYNNMYFEQGTDNNYTILKLDSNECRIHYTNDKNIKIIENHTEYTSFFRYLAIFSLNENKYYDVYLPNK